MTQLENYSRHLTIVKLYIFIRVGLYIEDHSFRSSWSPDRLVTLYLLIPFSKKKLKKVWKPGCPLRKMKKSKMAACGGKNWGIWPFQLLQKIGLLFWTVFSGREYHLRRFSCQGINFLRFLWISIFRFHKMAYFVKKWVFGPFSTLRANFNLKPFCKDYNSDCYYYLDRHRKFEPSSLIGFTPFRVRKNVPNETCTTQSSLTHVQTLWQAKRTLSMTAMGKAPKEKSWNFLCLSIMWFSFGLVTFKQQIRDDVREIVIKRPRLNFDQNCHFHTNEKSKFNETFRNGFLGNKTIKWHVYIKKKENTCKVLKRWKMLILTP